MAFLLPEPDCWDIMVLFHCMVRQVRFTFGGFPLGTVPGTWSLFQYHLGCRAVKMAEKLNSNFVLKYDPNSIYIRI